MKSNRKLILMLSGLLITPVAIADQTADYTYLSVGGVHDNSGWANPLAEKITNSFDGALNNESLILKKSTMGGYLRGSYDFGNGWFTETRLRGFSNRSWGYFAGLGYHMPMDENASCYVLAGLSQPNLPRKVRLNAMGEKYTKDNFSRLLVNYAAKNLTVGELKSRLNELNIKGKNIKFITDGLPEDQTLLKGCEENGINVTKKLSILKGCLEMHALLENGQLKEELAKKQDIVAQSKLTVKSQIAPAIEIGSQIKLTDDFKMRLAYQVRWDRSKLEGKLFDWNNYKEQSISETRKGLSHEGSVEGYYALGANWQAEVGYTISKMLKLGDVSPKAGHQVNVGLRYTF